MGQACPWHVRHRPCGAAAQGRGQAACDCGRRSLAPLPCSVLLLADWCLPPASACVCHSLPHESYNQMGTAEGVGRSVGAPPPPSVVSSPRTLPPLIAIRACAGVRPHCAAIANLLARAAAAARSGSHSSTSSIARCIIACWGWPGAGEKNRLVGTTAKRIPLFSVRAGQWRSKKWLQRIACSSWART